MIHSQVVTLRGETMMHLLTGLIFAFCLITGTGWAANVPPADHAFGSWNTLGTGFDLWVNTAIEYNGDLIVGGDFTQVGQIAARSIARWDGSEWHAMGTGLHGEVLALEVYSGQLIAGVQPAYWDTSSHPVPDTTTWIAKWDGSSWIDLEFPDTTAGDFHDFTIWDGKLVVAGMFEVANGAPSNHVAAWNGVSWEPLGGGLQETSSGMVWSLAVYQDDLYAMGGSIVNAAGDTINGIARFDGAEWQPLGSGLTSNRYDDPGQRLEVFRDKLVVGSSRLTAAGGIPVNYVATWDGVSWADFGYQSTSFLDMSTVKTIGDRVYFGQQSCIYWSEGGDLHLASFPEPGDGQIARVNDLYVWDTVVIWTGWLDDSITGAVLWKPVSEFTCCQGVTGNINGSADGVTDISDLTTLVNHLFVTYDPLPCPAEANTAAGEWYEGPIDISDLTRMVNYLFVTFENTDYCR